MAIEKLLHGPRAVRAGLVLCAALVAGPADAAKPTIGMTSLVVQQVEGTSERNTRQLAVRDPVYQDEVVVTGSQSASEMHLVDDTRITVGPGSYVVLDRFVYDPDPGKGALVLQATEGVFRFFSGTMASSSYAVETPSVTVGIRGTIFVGAIRPTDKTFVLILESRNSEIAVTAQSGDTVVLDAPGQAAIASPDGSVATGPVPAWAAAMVERMDGIILMADSDHADPGLDREVAVASAPGAAPARAAGDRGSDGRLARRGGDDSGVGGGDDDHDGDRDDDDDDGDRDDDDDDGDRNDDDDDGDRDDDGDGRGEGHGKGGSDKGGRDD